MKVNQLLKNRRIELGETQEKFGKRLGISHAAVSMIENGQTNHYTQEMIDLVLEIPFKEKCKACNGVGYVGKYGRWLA